MDSHPRATVLMAAYNARCFIGVAVESILGQTFADFELIVVDDGSTDNTCEVLGSYDDARIRVIHTDRNVGAARARNIGLGAARGEYVLVLDADDVAYPERLKRQADYLDENPEVALVGSSYDLIDEAGKLLNTTRPPTDQMLLRWRLLFGNPFGTSSTAYRRSVALEVGGYDETLVVAEDYAFCVRVAERYPVAQLADTLCAYRVRDSGLARTRPEALLQDTLEVSRRAVASLLGRQVAPAEVRRLLYLQRSQPVDSADVPYGLLQDCLESALGSVAHTAAERRRLVLAALPDLLPRAEQDVPARFQGLKVGVRAASKHVPSSLLSPGFLAFALRATITPGARRRLRRQLNWLVRRADKGATLE